MNADRFDKLLAFLDRLDQSKIPYDMRKHLDGAVSVEVFAPGEHWEVDFWADGDVYVERFRSNGTIQDESALEELFRLCSDEPVEATPTLTRDDQPTGN